MWAHSEKKMDAFGVPNGLIMEMVGDREWMRGFIAPPVFRLETDVQLDQHAAMVTVIKLLVRKLASVAILVSLDEDDDKLPEFIHLLLLEERSATGPRVGAVLAGANVTLILAALGMSVTSEDKPMWETFVIYLLALAGGERFSTFLDFILKPLDGASNATVERWRAEAMAQRHTPNRLKRFEPNTKAVSARGTCVESSSASSWFGAQ